MKRIIKIVCLVALIFSLCSCAKYNGVVKVQEDDKITLSGELLFQSDMIGDQAEEINDFINHVNEVLSNNIEFTEIEKTIDDVEYKGFLMSSKEPFESTLFKIQTSDNKTTLIIDENFLSVLDIDLDFLKENNDFKILSDLGVELNLTIIMPGKVISSSFGHVGLNDVKINLLDNFNTQLIIVSLASNIVYIDIAIGIVIIIVLIILIINYKKNNSRRLHLRMLKRINK